MPEVLNKGTLREQMNYLQEKTRIYEDYRAIREDMFQKIKDNAIDSLNLAKGKITGYAELTGTLNSRISSLKDSLISTQEELKETESTKNAISVIGIKVNKVTYN
jgi:translation initiation factor 2 alpha subunit (eIF-2alpha)